MDRRNAKRLCPMINNPKKNCYCARSGSRDVTRMLYYCEENFEECHIYRTMKDIVDMEQASKDR